MTWERWSIFLIGLVSIINPPAVLGPYLRISTGFPKDQRRRLAIRAGQASAAVLLVVVWGGETLLSLLGITVAQLQAAGGLIVILIALPMVMGVGEDEAEEPVEVPTRDVTSTAVVPVTIPLSIGAGVMAFVVAETSAVETLQARMLLSLACLVAALLLGVTFALAERVDRMLGVSGRVVVTRIMGIVLVAIGFGLLGNGLRVLLPGLAG